MKYVNEKGVEGMQQIIICEDDPMQLVALEEYIKRSLQVETEIFTYTSGKQLVNELHKFSQSCIFLLDIILIDENGIDIAKEINKVKMKSSIIFITAYIHLVTDIFDTRHVYFVLKSDLEYRLGIALQKALEQQNQNKMTIALQEGADEVILHVEDIIYIERELRITHVHMDDGIEKTSLKLNTIHNCLPSHFQRCHNSFIVNLKRVIRVNRKELILKDGVTIPVSRAYYIKVKQKVEEFIIKVN